MIISRRGLAALTAAGLMSAGLVTLVAPSASADHEGARFGPVAPVSEGARAVITVVRSDPSDTSTPVTVQYATSDTPSATTTATVGQDYLSASGTVTIAIGEDSATFAVQTIDDQQLENTEGVELVLGDPSASTSGDRAVLNIFDNETTGGGGGGGGGGTSPSPSASTSGSPSPSASASASPSASVSGSPSATSTVSSSPSATPSARLGISVSPATITPGIQSVVTVTGRAGTIVELLAYSRPNTTYGVVRRGVIGANGTIVFRVLPGTNTRLFAAETGQTGNESPSVVINVATALSLTVVRNGSRDYTFQGRILPRRAGQLITLYRVDNRGREIITSQIRTDASGTYRIRRVFVGSGVFGFLTRTGQNLTNAAGVSNGGRARPTAIYAGPQR